MMTTSDTDTRDTKAIEIAAGARQWVKCRAADGSKRYGIPSQRHHGVYHLADQLTCTCYDAHEHTCKHVRAVRLWVRAVARGVSVEELVAMPAADVVDGLAQMVNDRHPVLDMVREEDGTISWTRHDHTDGTAVYLPRPVATAQRYDEIFRKFEGE